MDRRVSVSGVDRDDGFEFAAQPINPPDLRKKQRRPVISNVRHINEKGEIAMKTSFLSLLAIVVLMVSGCAGTTPINNLALPPVSAIEGNITQLDESGFTLTDNSGSIHVRAKLLDNKKLDLSIGEKVKVYGNLQGGQENIFDGYVIKKSSGEQIIVSNPTPHFGFIIQSSFK